MMTSSWGFKVEDSTAGKLYGAPRHSLEIEWFDYYETEPPNDVVFLMPFTYLMILCLSGKALILALKVLIIRILWIIF